MNENRLLNFTALGVEASYLVARKTRPLRSQRNAQIYKFLIFLNKILPHIPLSVSFVIFENKFT
jgi:hypothetical protein